MSETHISAISVHKYHIVFLIIFFDLRIITTVLIEISENSYLNHFSAQVWEIVVLNSLTVLQLITTVWPEMSENSYLRHFSELLT